MAIQYWCCCRCGNYCFEPEDSKDPGYLEPERPSPETMDELPF